MKHTLRLAIKIGMPLLVTGSSVDLLYLYSIGAWYDPNKIIEYTEVALMVFFALLGLFIFVQTLLVDKPSKPLD